jgi:hypothetical protein
VDAPFLTGSSAAPPRLLQAGVHPGADTHADAVASNYALGHADSATDAHTHTIRPAQTDGHRDDFQRAAIQMEG